LRLPEDILAHYGTEICVVKMHLVARRESFILFCSISFYIILHMLLALQGTAGCISQSNKQEGQITYHSRSNSKPAETAETVAW